MKDGDVYASEPLLERAGTDVTPVGSSLGITGRAWETLKSTVATAGHTPWLDGWRGVCIAMVLLGHFERHFLGPLASLGVEMFFVLSGRLMAEMLIVRQQPMRTFVLRRFSRIMPLLALYTGITSLGLAAAVLISGAKADWLTVPGALLFFTNYLANPAALLEHTWSLAVEEHSYVLLLIVASLSARKPSSAAWISLLFAGGLMLLFYGAFATSLHDFWRSDVRGVSVLISFSVCLMLQQRQSPWLGRWLFWLSPLCLTGAAACMFIGNPWNAVQVTSCTILAAISVNTIQFSLTRFRRLLSLPMLTWLGTLSFSLYIWQQPFFLATLGGFPIVVAVPMTFICALWSFARVEAPARRYLNQRWANAPR